MSTGRLIINGKTWGEFESAKRIKSHIVISGYESYGGCHTVRGIKQSELNENQKLLLNWLKARFNETEIKAPCLFYLCELYQSYPYNLINVCKYYEEIEVVRAFVDWIEQEENSDE
ncbi:hypothetical protein IGJ63_001619 [Enterococcus sp. DIV1375a]|uniref:hypothetical protein n=1 Tax=Enterococcus sp. DIV1375a TaxID=2774755 RepID=UPI003F26AFBF